MLTLKGAELRAACARLRALLAVSDDESEIAREMQISWSDYEWLRRQLFELEEVDLRKRSDAQWFVEYLMKQRRNQGDLTTMIAEFRASKQFNAMIGAVKARASINDSIIKLGQEFGFISKVPERKEVVHGHLIADMSNAEVRKMFAETVHKSRALAERYGNEETSIIDMPLPQIHREDPKKAVNAGAPPARHARNRVHKGRRVVKEKA